MILNGSAQLNFNLMSEGGRERAEPLLAFVFGKVHPIWTPRCSNVSSKGLSYAIRRIWLKTLSRSQTHFGLPNVIYIKLLELVREPLGWGRKQKNMGDCSRANLRM